MSYRIVFFLRSFFKSCFSVFPYLLRWGDLRKKVTENYPDPVSCKTPNDLPVRSRGLLFNDIDVCTGCGECQKICPTQCIQIELQPGSSEAKLWVSQFDIDFGSCVFCGLCVQVCEPGSLIHTRHYEAAAYSAQDLVARFGRGQVTLEQQRKWALLRQKQATHQEEEGLF